ncbi:MAG: hypothetical protein IJ422_03785 [Oscillospiraceae bacterium]|nr:hypothetical protein [Oscillospiraceae bacterium]
MYRQKIILLIVALMLLVVLLMLCKHLDGIKIESEGTKTQTIDKTEPSSEIHLPTAPTGTGAPETTPSAPSDVTEKPTVPATTAPTQKPTDPPTTPPATPPVTKPSEEPTEPQTESTPQPSEEDDWGLGEF